VFKSFLNILIERTWYSKNLICFLLLPLSWIYIFFFRLRSIYYNIFKTNIIYRKTYAPTIVVGNIVVGGTGKTPLVIWLARYYKKKGYSPGIITRGYKGLYSEHPRHIGLDCINTFLITPDTDPELAGDEAVLIANNTNCPVLVAINRQVAAKRIVEEYRCNLVISDDGLQHHSLARNIEIAVIDGQRRLGNGYCIPAGPLREPKNRLDSVDLVVSKYSAKECEYKMDYIYNELVSLSNPKDKMSITNLETKKIHAVAGIANPHHFFSFLRSQSYELLIHKYPDHYKFNHARDIEFNDDLPVIMTEKDAVKCKRHLGFGRQLEHVSKKYWYLPISVKLPESFSSNLNQLLEKNYNE